MSGNEPVEGGNGQAASAPRQRVSADVLFFPAAALYAVLVLPVSVLEMLGRARFVPGIASPAGHAHELLFGFALAAVAGNQLGPTTRPRLALLFALWALARASFLLAPQSPAAAAANVAFAAVLAAQLAPRLLRSAKKPRNKALPLVLVAICAAAIAFQVAGRLGRADVQFRILLAAVLLFALLMIFMGGRLIAPAVAGQFYRQGENLEARVQPRIEGALIACMAAAIAVSTASGPAWVEFGAALLIASGLLAAVRIVRWRLWALRGRPDLLSLAAGYGWLAAGLALFGASRAGGIELFGALHLITVGALGTLTLNVMAMTRMLKAGRDPARSRVPPAGTALIAVAALARALAGSSTQAAVPLLALAALCWSAAFALLLGLMARTPARPPRPLE
ncbi:MAG: NnrS family protein [Betaproteobacteria bacterium]|nr:NnrS family protein [Betaproteobacteria bacterium]